MSWLQSNLLFAKHRLGFDKFYHEESQGEISKIIIKKDKENIQIILEGVYIRDTFMASDDIETVERKKMEVSEFLKNNIK